jgi:DNA polymerase-1
MQILDGGMFAFAAWHVLKGRVAHPLAFQVPRMLRKVLGDAEDAVFVCWNGENLWKRERMPAYRDRLEIWEEAGREDFEAMLSVLSAFGVVQFRTEAIEADEVLAALVHRFEGREEILIRSDDKDFFQLLTATTTMEGRVRKTIGVEDVVRITGVLPERIADWLAVTGDKADGLPRVLGPKTAARLLNEHGPLRDWLEDEAVGSAGERKKLNAHRDEILLNLEIADLSAAAVPKIPEPWLERHGDAGALKELGERLEITYLREDGVADEYDVLRRTGRAALKALGVP